MSPARTRRSVTIEKRRQNHSCEQCRRSKKACDGYVMNENQHGPVALSILDSPDAPPTAFPCSYCARTKKECSLNPYWARQRRASRAFSVDEEATENNWVNLEPRGHLQPHKDEDTSERLLISLPPSLDPWNGASSSWLSLGLVDFLALATHVSPATYSSSSPKSASSADVFFDDLHEANFTATGGEQVKGNGIMHDTAYEPSTAWVDTSTPGLAADDGWNGYHPHAPEAKRRKADCSDYLAARFAMEPVDRELISDSMFRILHGGQADGAGV